MCGGQMLVCNNETNQWIDHFWYLGSKNILKSVLIERSNTNIQKILFSFCESQNWLKNLQSLKRKIYKEGRSSRSFWQRLCSKPNWNRWNYPVRAWNYATKSPTEEKGQQFLSEMSYWRPIGSNISGHIRTLQCSSHPVTSIVKLLRF